ncbi:hypothetical protein MAPG_11646 [Magnaporthiopsis poae ATCC 64411]|uniref:Uncharacterized protein n=1 Tax=Magnaporthiopsis poae (strain ATCC 64411 / 73-15) TaxID=644358 RepID=A0A0C4EFT9_MAGP6|nr:hypothetical protein MAPG_11646 [Magnaporthiopsis poae ATCC 64411]
MDIACESDSICISSFVRCATGGGGGCEPAAEPDALMPGVPTADFAVLYYGATGRSAGKPDVMWSTKLTGSSPFAPSCPIPFHPQELSNRVGLGCISGTRRDGRKRDPQHHPENYQQGLQAEDNRRWQLGVGIGVGLGLPLWTGLVWILATRWQARNTASMVAPSK